MKAMVRDVALASGLALAAGAWLASGAATAADKTVRIGAPLPLTGPLSPEGIKQKNGYDLWAELVNGKGGIRAGGDSYKIEIVYSDYQSNTPRAVQLTEKLITDDKVNFLFSPFGSGATKAASAVSEKYGIPTIAVSASSEAVYDQGYEYLFGMLTPNRSLTKPFAEIVRSKFPDAKRFAILSRNDLFPLAIANAMQESAKARGFEIVFFEKYAIGAMDHASALTQIRGARPDWVFATGYVNDLILIRKQMADLGLKPKVISMIAGPAYQEFIDATGELAETVSSAAWWHPSVKYEGKVFGSTANYTELYRNKYGATPDYIQAAASAAGVLFQHAIEKSGGIDPKKVRDALASIDVTTFYGPVRLGETGQITSLKPPLFQIKGGEHKVFYPEEIKQTELSPTGM